jgi:hypothetical protein
MPSVLPDKSDEMNPPALFPARTVCIDVRPEELRKDLRTGESMGGCLDNIRLHALSE